MKITVVTVCRNCEKTIEENLKSVAAQTFDDYEHLIVDGASTDKTIKIVQEFDNPKIKLISEPDNGIYDAMNKGVNNAKGEYIIFLNADDKFADENVLKRAAEKMNTKKDLYYGDLTFFDVEKNTYNTRKQNNVNFVYICGGMLFHPTIFAAKKLFDRAGLFDTNYRIVADYEWILRVLTKFGATLEYLGFTTTIFTQGTGASTTPENKEKHKAERKKVQALYFSKVQSTICNFWYKSMRSTLKIAPVKYLLQKSFFKNR